MKPGTYAKHLKGSTMAIILKNNGQAVRKIETAPVDYLTDNEISELKCNVASVCTFPQAGEYSRVSMKVYFDGTLTELRYIAEHGKQIKVRVRENIVPTLTIERVENSNSEGAPYMIIARAKSSELFIPEKPTKGLTNVL